MKSLSNGVNALFVSNDPLIFTAGSAVRGRMREYAKFFDALYVISPAPNGSERIEEGNLILYPLFASKLFRIPAIARMARTLIRTQNISVVSAQDPFEHGLAALYATTRTNAKLHIQIHADFLSPFFARESLLNRLRVVIASIVLQSADSVRVVSERIRRSLVARYGEEMGAASVIPVALSLEVPAAVPFPTNSFMFSFIAVSRLEAEKHIADILAALVLVNRKYPKAGLFIVGSGRLETALRRRVEALGLSENVVFLGSRTDARGLMKSAQAFVQASAHEGYGLTLIEAALAGTPIATTEVGVVGDVLVSEKDALISNPENPEALAHNMLRLIENNALRESLSAHAKEAAEIHRSRYVHQPQMVADDIIQAVKDATEHV